MVDRLIPPVDEDMDALDDEKITAVKESRNLKDIFLEKRGGVHGCTRGVEVRAPTTLLWHNSSIALKMDNGLMHLVSFS